ncbi:hypothetical protein AURDEDRAFT_128137 [Auricularia subglabra TFB-10046 SS5]|nr:hypothetical protein AURDEDRAFT_128137 [Auricularia subglabra TFB-10046 SS5]
MFVGSWTTLLMLESRRSRDRVGTRGGEPIYAYTSSVYVAGRDEPVTVHYRQTGPPIAHATLVTVSGKFSGDNGDIYIGAKKIKTLQRVDPNADLKRFVYTPCLVFDAFITGPVVQEATASSDILFFDAVVYGPEISTIRCIFDPAAIVVERLPILYERHKISVIGDVCDYQDGRVAVKVLSFSCIVYPPYMTKADVIFRGKGADQVTEVVECSISYPANRYCNPRRPRRNERSARRQQLFFREAAYAARSVAMPSKGPVVNPRTGRTNYPSGTWGPLAAVRDYYSVAGTCANSCIADSCACGSDISPRASSSLVDLFASCPFPDTGASSSTAARTRCSFADANISTSSTGAHGCCRFIHSRASRYSLPYSRARDILSVADPFTNWACRAFKGTCSVDSGCHLSSTSTSSSRGDTLVRFECSFSGERPGYAKHSCLPFQLPGSRAPYVDDAANTQLSSPLLPSALSPGIASTRRSAPVTRPLGPAATAFSTLCNFTDRSGNMSHLIQPEPPASSAQPLQTAPLLTQTVGAADVVGAANVVEERATDGRPSASSQAAAIGSDTGTHLPHDGAAADNSATTGDDSSGIIGTSVEDPMPFPQFNAGNAEGQVSGTPMETSPNESDSRFAGQDVPEVASSLSDGHEAGNPMETCSTELDVGDATQADPSTPMETSPESQTIPSMCSRPVASAEPAQTADMVSMGGARTTRADSPGGVASVASAALAGGHTQPSELSSSVPSAPSRANETLPFDEMHWRADAERNASDQFEVTDLDISEFINCLAGPCSR